MSTRSQAWCRIITLRWIGAASWNGGSLLTCSKRTSHLGESMDRGHQGGLDLRFTVAIAEGNAFSHVQSLEDFRIK